MQATELRAGPLKAETEGWDHAEVLLGSLVGWGPVSEAGRLGLLHPPHLLGNMGPELILSKSSVAWPVWLSV